MTPHMRALMHVRIMGEMKPLWAEINRREAVRMARAKGPLGAWGAPLRWGL